MISDCCPLGDWEYPQKGHLMSWGLWLGMAFGQDFGLCSTKLKPVVNGRKADKQTDLLQSSSASHNIML